ncbi:hypothetical protein K1719_017094 [Acacia pycnantha]|nr:hypothetical protein K1719_017094 [Acacia pycnantha]
MESGEKFEMLFMMHMLGTFLAPTSSTTPAEKLLKVLTSTNNGFARFDWATYIAKDIQKELADYVNAIRGNNNCNSYVGGCIYMLLVLKDLHGELMAEDDANDNGQHADANDNGQHLDSDDKGEEGDGDHHDDGESEETEEMEAEMEIGYPTDVKYLTHIGLDGSTTTTNDDKGWDNLKPPPELLSLSSISFKQFEIAMAAQAHHPPMNDLNSKFG